MNVDKFAEELRGGDRRSIGNADAVAADVSAHPQRFESLILLLQHPDAIVRMRAADAAEKVSIRRPDLLTPHRTLLLQLAARAQQQELRWHLAQMLPRLPLTGAQRHRAFATLEAYLLDDSRIVNTCALQGLVDLSDGHPELRARALRHLRAATDSRIPSLRARARRLLATFTATRPEQADQS